MSTRANVNEPMSLLGRTTGSEGWTRSAIGLLTAGLVFLVAGAIYLNYMVLPVPIEDVWQIVGA
jgi:hypothetical protein